MEKRFFTRRKLIINHTTVCTLHRFFLHGSLLALFLAPSLGSARTAAQPVDQQTPPAPEVRTELAERKVKQTPDDEDSWSDLVEARLLSNDLDRATAALAAWRKAVTTPSSLSYRLEGDIALARGETKEAIGLWQKRVGATPSDAEAWERLADGLAQVGELEAAADASTKQLALARSADRLAWHAKLLTRLHRWKEAEATALAANRLEPAHTEVQAIYPIFERISSWLPALLRIEEALKKDRENTTLLLDRAELLVKESLIDAAADDAKKAAELAPHSLRARLWSAWLATLVGKPLPSDGNIIAQSLPDKAMLERLRQLDTNSTPEVAEARATFLLEINQPVLASELATDAGSPAKAEALYRLGRLPAARTAAEEAVHLHPKDASAWATYGKIALDNGNIGDALKAFDRALALKPWPELKELRDTTAKRRD